jgi:ssDNA-binding Zn-finger/Zn-ribbon topoisomerase 1
MFDNARMLDLIERTLDADPFCPVCGAPTDVRDHDGRLWIECSTAPTEERNGLIARLEVALLGHPRRLIVDLREDLAA